MAHEAELIADFTPAEREAYRRLRASGLSLSAAVAVILRHRRLQAVALAA